MDRVAGAEECLEAESGECLRPDEYYWKSIAMSGTGTSPWSRVSLNMTTCYWNEGRFRLKYGKPCKFSGLSTGQVLDVLAFPFKWVSVNSGQCTFYMMICGKATVGHSYKIAQIEPCRPGLGLQSQVWSNCAPNCRLYFINIAIDLSTEP